MIVLAILVAFVLGFNACSMLDDYAAHFMGKQMDQIERNERLLPEPWLVKVWKFIYCKHGAK